MQQTENGGKQTQRKEGIKGRTCKHFNKQTKKPSGIQTGIGYPTKSNMHKEG